jgi:hypothetical protein
MGDERATRAIERGLSARSWNERTLAVQAAGEARLTGCKNQLLAMRKGPSIVDQEVLDEALERLARPA